MGDDLHSVGILVRREIEALLAVPLIRGFMEEVGREKAMDIVGNVIRDLALQSGRLLATLSGGNSMESLAKGVPLFSQGGALEIDVLEAGRDKISMNVTRCRYAEMYKEHGMEEFGYLLSCGRDFSLVEGFNPKIRLTRTQTIMEGADHCDFRFTMEPE
jgi:hypothetical protein